MRRRRLTGLFALDALLLLIGYSVAILLQDTSTDRWQFALVQIKRCGIFVIALHTVRHAPNSASLSFTPLT